MKSLIAGAALLLMLTLFINIPANSQNYHQLTANDFQGAPHPESGAIAYTDCYIFFNYIPHYRNNYYVLDFKVELKLNNEKSWIDKKRITSSEMMKEILKHEQGHYTIAYMEQQEVLRAVSRVVFHEDYLDVAKNIFHRINDKYQQLNLDYDEDTNHSLNRVQQHSWDLYFAKRMTYMPPLASR